VNFYKRYMADYAQKTARLSLAEHGAYTLLLDELYSTEKPLPADHSSLFRICRAMDKTEQAAVKSVADKYFPIDVNGTRSNPRALAEITEAAPAMEAARLNGKKGGRPRKEPDGLNKNNPMGFEKQTQTEPSSKPPHSSDNYSIPSGIEIVNAPKPRPLKKCPSDFSITMAMQDWSTEHGITVDLKTETEKFKDYTFNRAISDWQGAWRNWIRKAQDYEYSKLKPTGFAQQNFNKQEALEARNADVARRWVESQQVAA
jgi:uncharacterized protein YdaU (DUF1376 family)